MAINTTQMAERLFKKSQGFADKASGRPFYEESPNTGRQTIFPDQVYTDPLPTLYADAEAAGLAETVTISNIPRIAGTDAYFDAGLKRAIPFNFGTGYDVQVNVGGGGAVIAFPEGWILDGDTGVLRFYDSPNTLPSSVDVTFKRYLGQTLADAGGSIGGGGGISYRTSAVAAIESLTPSATANGFVDSIGDPIAVGNIFATATLAGSTITADFRISFATERPHYIDTASAIPFEAGDRVLIFNDLDGKINGLWEVSTDGTNWWLELPEDFDYAPVTEVRSNIGVFALSGTYANAEFILIGSPADVQNRVTSNENFPAGNGTTSADDASSAADAVVSIGINDGKEWAQISTGGSFDLTNSNTLYNGAGAPEVKTIKVQLTPDAGALLSTYVIPLGLISGTRYDNTDYVFDVVDNIGRKVIVDIQRTTSPDTITVAFHRAITANHFLLATPIEAANANFTSVNAS